MQKLSLKPGWLLRYQELYIFIGILLWISIIYNLSQPSHSWHLYLVSFLAACITQFPVLVLVACKSRLQQILTPKRYLLLWIACFGIWVPAVALVSIYFKPASLPGDFLPVVCICVVILELVLEGNNWLRKQAHHRKWIRQISLDSAILLTLALVSLTLAAMAVSSMGNPAYHTKERLLIAFVFDLHKIATRFGTFISFSLQFMFMYSCAYLFYYINSRFLISKILKQKGIILYVLSALATTAILYPLIAQVLLWLPLNTVLGNIFNENPFQWENAFAALAIIVLSLPVILAIQWSRQNNQIMALEKEKAQTELDLLKQQINPHFFFNTLNNLYSLSLQKSEQTPDTILQLSELMRYVIYKGQEAQVSVHLEIKYIEDYLQLQMIRLRQTVDLRFEKHISNDKQPIAPLLLIVLIENAFKHGIEPAEESSFLHLYLQCDDAQLSFRCENSVEPGNITTGGIGLLNLQKRLQVLYPGKHSLKTATENHTFKAELQLILS